MRVTVKGNNPVSSDNVKQVIDTLNEDYKHLGIQVKNLTMYVRFVDEAGNNIEPVEDGMEIRRTFTFNKVKETKGVQDGSNKH